MSGHWVCALVSALFLSACQTSPERTAADKFGPHDLFSKPVEDVDIIAALSRGTQTGQGKTGEEFAKAFDAALRAFTPVNDLERNRIQDRLLLASNELCENYKVLLKRKQSRFNFWSGAAATVFGAAGGVVTGSDGARVLSALSGTTSGVRAEYNEQYFSDLAAHVITKGINARRKEILSVIELGRAKTTGQYTMETAIADAITYHGACSLVGGLEQADSTLSKFDDFVGLDALGANPSFKLRMEKTKSGEPETPTTPTNSDSKK